MEAGLEWLGEACGESRPVVRTAFNNNHGLLADLGLLGGLFALFILLCRDECTNTMTPEQQPAHGASPPR